MGHSWPAGAAVGNVCRPLALTRPSAHHRCGAKNWTDPFSIEDLGREECWTNELLVPISSGEMRLSDHVSECRESAAKVSTAAVGSMPLRFRSAPPEMA